MGAETSPAFLFYPKDYLSSRKVQRMTYAARGMYLEMLIEQWQTGSVPGSPVDCAAALGGTTAEWQEAWPMLERCFSTKFLTGRSVPNGRLVNLKLELVRRERQRYKKAQRDSGLRGAEARWKRHSEPIGSPSQPIASPMAKNGSGSSSPSDLHLQEDGRTPPPAVSARSKRPIFKGKRLVVFEWMFDDLMKLLGPLADEFDLHAWFSELDARMVTAPCVIPQRDSGQWLQEQTLAEAKRRGLPIAVNGSGASAGKQSSRLAAALVKIQAEGAR